ncbi:hypothetical protein BXP70_12290 [Hymenobacter crusticola]|uniref:Secretion system C-terminal sorting domain-containing protein n=2 Tax=Hymenobacter crusticola TaxID=1770526 RepID=A0A243WFQ6_9BACT|nr:hypothetical protein BXP70_12290 [Hymenobacter crusticola]
MGYRVYLETAAPGAFSFIELGYRNRNGNNKLWDQTTQGIDLLSLAGTNGTYVLEVYFEGNVNNSDKPSIYDSNSSQNYKATFAVSGTLPTTWTGRNSTEWGDDGNWTNSKPTTTNDAIIPTGLTRYPEIIAGQAQVRNLVIAGDSPERKALIKLTNGRLEVYGNFTNLGNLDQAGGVFQLAANGNQTFDGSDFFNFEVSGSGIKKLNGIMSVRGELRFQGGILYMDPTLEKTSYVNLTNNAVMLGESNDTYLSGTLKAVQIVTMGDVATFGGIGLRYENFSGDPGTTQVTRSNVSYTSASNTGQSVRRAFNITPANNITAQITINYLDNELGTSNQNENNLVMYRSTNSATTFDQLGKDGQDTRFNFVTKGQVPGNGFFVLSQQRAPLPVALISFTAARQGSDAILTWATAQEENNAGFDVQVSTNGESFRTLTTITPNSPNSTVGSTYKYADQELGKNGIRYYRLRQVDVDGKESFYGPQAVEFGDAAVAFSAAPNPFTSEVMLTAQTSVAGAATIRLTDINGRTVREQALSIDKGVSTLPVSNLDGLKGGMYFMQLTLPNGQVQRLKVLKQ